MPCPEYQQGLRWSDKYEVYSTPPRSKARELAPDTTDYALSPANVATDRQTRRRAKSPGRDDIGPYNSTTPSLTDRAEFSGATRALDGRSSTSDVGTWESSRTDDEPISNLWDSRSTRRISVPESAISLVSRVSSSPLFSSAAPSDVPSLAGRLNTEGNELASQEPEAHISTPRFHPSFQTNPESSDLLKFYFNDLCRKNSVFDSQSNPFRYLIIQWMEDSPLIFNCVLSMSARALVARRPDILPKAVRHHTAAVGYLTDILSNLTRQATSDTVNPSSPPREVSVAQIKQAVLASILLGISSVSSSFPLKLRTFTKTSFVFTTIAN